MPTPHFEYTLMCMMSSDKAACYFNNLSPKELRLHQQREQYLLRRGWTPLKTSEDLNISLHGYFAVAYYRIDTGTNTAELVFAHRGTCLRGTALANIVGNLLADFEIIARTEPRILRDSAKAYCDQILKDDIFHRNSIQSQYSINKVPITKITHTGFSLGGFIAAALTGLSPRTDITAVTVDAPGADFLPFNHAQKAPAMTHYLTTPNLVNTCNRHIGSKKKLTAFPDTPELITTRQRSHRPKKLKVDMETLIRLFTTRESHNLEKILDILEMAHGTIHARNVYHWPVANNQPVYGEDKPLEDIALLKADNFFAFLINFVIGGMQLGAHGLSKMIWELTQKTDRHGRTVGLISVRHSCDYRIFYTQADYQRHHQPPARRPQPRDPIVAWDDNYEDREDRQERRLSL